MSDGRYDSKDKVCSECDHTLDQHWLHGCRAVVSVDSFGQREMDFCSCKRPRNVMAWTVVNCLHCLHLKRAKHYKVREVVTTAGERVPVNENMVSRSLVTCAKNNWEGYAYLQAVQRALSQPRNFFRRQAVECADFSDMRPRYDEIECEHPMCHSTDGLAYNQHGIVACVDHKGGIIRSEELCNMSGIVKGRRARASSSPSSKKSKK